MDFDGSKLWWKYFPLLTFTLILIGTTFCRELHIADNYADKNESQDVDFYPDFETCVRTDDFIIQVDVFTQGGNWSPFVDRFLFYDNDKPDGFGEEILLSYWLHGEWMRLFYARVIWWAGLMLVSLYALVAVPVCGAFICLVLAFLCIAFVKSFKHVGRYFVITHERIRRLRQMILIPPKKHLRKKFRMPDFFRNYSDEEIPKSLRYHYSDNSADSSDDHDEEERLIVELERKARDLSHVSPASSVTTSIVESELTGPAQHRRKKPENSSQLEGVRRGSIVEEHGQFVSHPLGAERRATYTNRVKDHYYIPEVWKNTTAEPPSFFENLDVSPMGGGMNAVLSRTDHGSKAHELGPDITETLTHINLRSSKSEVRQKPTNGKMRRKHTGKAHKTAKVVPRDKESEGSHD